MSQTPLELGAEARASGYMEAWRAILRWTTEGRSWSGREKHCCFLNTGGDWFADISAVSGLNFADDGRGLATVDWDHDGDLDLWMSNRLSPQVRYLRNDAAGHRQFIAFRLVGTACNRDAIGARVEVTAADDDAARPQVRARTVRAGEGFLSQSSKWLHFGLGAATSVQQVAVQWPDGSRETFAELPANQHYRIVQGEGTATVWQRPTAASELPASEVASEPFPSSSAHWLAARYPLPRLEYLSADGTQQRLAVADRGGPLLLNLWASWCTPCVEELTAWTAEQALFEQAGVQVLALTVDGLEDDGTAPEASPRTLQQLGFPFDWARATPELVAALQQTHDDLLTTRQPLPIPCSFLLDSGGELAAIYWGAVSPQQVVADVARLSLSGDALFDSAVPRPGHWEWRPRGIRGPAYYQQAQTAARRLDFELALAAVAKAIDEAPDFVPARLLSSTLWKHVGESDRAVEQLEAALDLDPNNAFTLAWLGDLRLEQGELEAASSHFEKLLSQSPTDPSALQRWGKLLVRRGDFSAAVDHLQRAIEQNPDNAALHGDLALAWQGLGRYREAFEEFRRALERDATLLQTSAEFAWLLATCEDETIRRGDIALAVARQCVEKTKGRDPAMLDKLAAAQAETGRFEEAAATGRRARALAQQQDRPRLAAEIETRIALYEAGQPYRAPRP